MNERLPDLVFVAGIGQLCVLFAMALVPWWLNWKEELASLKRLHSVYDWATLHPAAAGQAGLALTGLFYGDAENLSEYRWASLIWNFRRTGRPASRLTSAPDFQLTTCSSRSPISSWQSCMVNPLMGFPSADRIATRTPPTADVAKLMPSELPWKVSGRVTNSPPR